MKFVYPAAPPGVKFPAVVAEFEDGDPPQSLVELSPEPEECRRQSLLTIFRCFLLAVIVFVVETAPALVAQ